MIARLRFAIAALAALAWLACAPAHAAGIGGVSQQQVKVTPNSNAYSAGQCLGGVLTVPNVIRPQGPGGTRLAAVSFVDPQHQTAANDAMTLLIFTALPTGTYTDHANCNVAAADLPNLAGQVTIAAANCFLDQAPSTTVCTITPALPLNVAMPVTNGSIYVVPIVAATPTYGASASLYFNFMAEPYTD
jgi:hypothetical protein